MAKKPINPADRILRTRLREPLHFPDLTERLALKLSAIPHYVARAHFGIWHRRFGGPDLETLEGVFTPLFHVDIETADVALHPNVPLHVRGETFLAKTTDAWGGLERLAREGAYRLFAPGRNGAAVAVGRARLVNVFTRNDPDPARRRVKKLPAEMGLGDAPDRTTVLPTLHSLLPQERAPDFREASAGVWHYEQTDPNRHVNGMEYLHLMQAYVAQCLRSRGFDAGRMYFSRARIVYRKPCFRGEGYHRAVWLRSEAPLVATGVFYKEEDSARPAVAIELTVSQHER